MRAPGRQFADPITGDPTASIDLLLVAGCPVVVVFVDGENPALEARLARLTDRLCGRVTMRTLRDAAFARAFGVGEFPSAVAVDTVGRISFGPVYGDEKVEELIRLVAKLESRADEEAGVTRLGEAPAYLSTQHQQRRSA